MKIIHKLSTGQHVLQLHGQPAPTSAFISFFFMSSLFNFSCASGLNHYITARYVRGVRSCLFKMLQSDRNCLVIQSFCRLICFLESRLQVAEWTQSGLLSASDDLKSENRWKSEGHTQDFRDQWCFLLGTQHHWSLLKLNQVGFVFK